MRKIGRGEMKMISDEEKEAIKKIKSFNQYNWEMNNLKEKEFAKPYFDAIETVLNLIETQQKEIEELKEKNKELEQEQVKRRWVHIKENGEVEPLFYISKDKIKAKIEEIKKKRDKKPKNEKESGFNFVENTQITILQSLLEKE